MTRRSGGRRRVRRLGRMAALAVAALAVAACDDGPEGPGSWNGLVRSSTAGAGAVILQVDGSGVQEIEGVGDTSAFARRTDGGGVDGRWRVVLVSSTPGPLAFRVRVDDMAADAPRAVVLSAVDGLNQPFADVNGFSVEMRR